jgi:hypothetical protein
MVVPPRAFRAGAGGAERDRPAPARDARRYSRTSLKTREASMSSDLPATISDTDVRSLAAKLKGLHALLTPAEQTLLHTVLRRAAEREASDAPDTEGFGWMVSFNPFTYLDAIEADVRQKARGD